MSDITMYAFFGLCLAGAALCLVGSRGAAWKGVVFGLLLGSFAGIPSALDIARSNGPAAGFEFAVFLGAYVSWLGGGIGALVVGCRRTAALALVSFGGFVVFGLSSVG
jgi:hypothetical protein